MSKKRLFPIGVDDYKVMIEGDYVYVDKTLVIKEFWEDGAPVSLVTRPRRFGKSITLSMLKYFFEKTENPNASLFEKSNIWKEGGFKELQGTYPVIYISFKDVKMGTWEEAYQELKNLLAKEVYRTLDSVKSRMDDYHGQKYEALINETANETKFSESLLFITEVFKKYLGKNTIILIDEYDAPIVHAYVHKFYHEMVEFMRQLLSKALKGNTHLHKGFMTGVVRTAKDGILSGLNNPDIYTMLDSGYADKFGFTESETDQLLKKMDLLDKKEEVKSWYNGYVIGSKHQLCTKVYNPWSVLKYLKNFCTPETYWANTGSTSLLERMIAEANETTQRELKLLLEGNCLENKQINQDVILLDLDKENVDPWSFLFFAGYLTVSGHVFEDKKHCYTLKIPNEEIAELYKKLVIGALNKTFSSSKLEQLLSALITGNLESVNRLLGEFVGSMCSSHDLPYNDLERSLHLFVLGLLASLSERYVIKSNLESGSGRYDILMHPKNNSDAAVILELKRGNSSESDKLAEEALTQIKEKKYASFLRDFGYKGKVICYGIAIFKKSLVAKMEVIS